MSFYRNNALTYTPPLQVWVCPNDGEIVIPAEYRGQQHIAMCTDCGAIYSIGKAREGDAQLSLSTDVVTKAERIIDDHIERTSGDVVLTDLYDTIRVFCEKHGAGKWFQQHFSKRGWEVIIGGRLTEHRYQQYPNQKGRWHK